MTRKRRPADVRRLIGRGLALASFLLPALVARGDDEAVLFTPQGFSQPGKPATAQGPESGKLAITVLDAETGRPTPGRVNVVGPDGNFYQPTEDRLSLYSLTGEWPKTGKGNRAGKAPIRYFGRFFYTTGAVTVPVPRGEVRVEVWKGLEYLPRTATATVGAGTTATVEVVLHRATGLTAFDHDSGDPHLHLLRKTEADEEVIFDLLEAEDVRYGTPLMYNEPAGPYTGVRTKLDYPQLRGLGAESLRSRGAYHILSGQEYRTGTYGHLNLFLRDDLVREGESYNADNWPAYGAVGRETQEKGGFAIYAHGGYAQSIYADFVRGDVNAVELLQFGVYRGIELDDWYHILNIGYRFPIVGASDYPACRKLADCVTYVRREPGKPQDFAGWLRGAVEGRSFVTTGPILLLEVDGQKPGAAVAKAGPGPHPVPFKARVFSAVTPFSELQLVVNGRVVDRFAPPGGMKREVWYELTGTVPLRGPSWVAARAFGTAVDGSPDAEAHTNPVYFHVDGKAPYDRGSLDHLVGKLDGLMAKTRARSFPEKAKVLDRFQGSRDLLLKIRAAGGLPATGLPADWVAEVDQARFDPSARSHTDAELAEFLKPVPPRTPSEAAEVAESAGGSA